MRLLHIGRATTNDIVIADTTVSRQHAQLMIDDIGQVTLIDLSSSNGTFVNGRRISVPTQLDAMDIVKVGEYLLPWRQYVQSNPQTQVGNAAYPVVEQAAAHSVASPQAQPISDHNSVRDSSNKRKLWITFGVIGAVAAVILVVAILIYSNGSSKPDFVGKWRDTEDSKAWIKFEENGKYSEYSDSAEVFDDATWKAMGVDRLLIQRGKISIHKKYKFEGEKLLLTYIGKTTTYERVSGK
jgi:hypothetical protein